MLEIISIYLGILVASIGDILFAKITLNKKIEVDIKVLIFIFFLSTFFNMLMYMYLDGTIKTSLLYIAHMLEFKVLFNTSYFKAIFLTFLYAIVLMMVEVIILLSISNLGMSIIFLYDEFAGSVLSNIVISTFFVLLTFILKKPLRKIVNTEISHNIKILLLSVSTFLCVVMIFYSVIRTYRFSNDIVLYLIAMIVLIAILFSLIKQTIDNNKLIKEYDKLLEFMTTYEIEIEKQRILRHETKNEFLAIKAKLCDKQKNKEIIEYIDEILKEKIIVNQEKYAKFGYLPPNGIKGLCYFKVEEAYKKGIKISLNISSKIKKSSIYNLNTKNQRDLGKILGVFLDNAIEASSNTDKKLLGLEMYVNKDNETIVIISNTFNNEINRVKLGKEKFSTKGKDRGHGLLLVNHIIKNSIIFDINTNIVNGVYTQNITIKNK